MLDNTCENFHLNKSNYIGILCWIIFVKYHTTMDKSLQELNILLRDGLITNDTYADSISTLRMQERSIPASRTVKPVPTPRAVKKPAPTPRTVKPVPTPRTKRQLILDEPIPATVQDRLPTPLQPKRLQCGYSDKDIDDYIQEIYDEIQEPLEVKQEPNLGRSKSFPRRCATPDSL